METPAWEKSKENVAPVARGRSKGSLHVALKATRSEIQEARRAHEEGIRIASNGEGRHADDPLAPSVALVKWAVDAYMPRAPQILQILERACYAFLEDERYKNDPRYVRVWVMYSENRDDAPDVFTFMRQHGIGRTQALFYEAWAASLEVRRDFPKTDAVYKLGISREAHPVARLEQRYEEFQARMVRRSERDAARSSKRSTRRAAPRAVDSAPKDENERPALGGLSTRQAVTGHRPLAPLSALTSNSSTRAPGRNADTSFRVLVDDGAEDGDVLGDEAGSAPFPALARVDSVRKEDEGELPARWAGVTMPQSSPLARSRARAARSRKKGFEVFEDDCEEEPPSAVPDAERADPVYRRRNWTAAGPPSPTIHTKLAMQQVDDMFNTTLRIGEAEDDPTIGGREDDMEVDEAPQCEAVSKPDFVVFCDE